MQAALGAEGIVVATGSSLFYLLPSLSLADLLPVNRMGRVQDPRLASHLRQYGQACVRLSSLPLLTPFAELTGSNVKQLRLRRPWNPRRRQAQGDWIQGLHHWSWRGDLDRFFGIDGLTLVVLLGSFLSRSRFFSVVVSRFSPPLL